MQRLNMLMVEALDGGIHNKTLKWQARHSEPAKMTPTRSRWLRTIHLMASAIIAIASLHSPAASDNPAYPSCGPLTQLDSHYRAEYPLRATAAIGEHSRRRIEALARHDPGLLAGPFVFAGGAARDDATIVWSTPNCASTCRGAIVASWGSRISTIRFTYKQNILAVELNPFEIGGEHDPGDTWTPGKDAIFPDDLSRAGLGLVVGYAENNVPIAVGWIRRQRWESDRPMIVMLTVLADDPIFGPASIAAHDCLSGDW